MMIDTEVIKIDSPHINALHIDPLHVDSMPIDPLPVQLLPVEPLRANSPNNGSDIDRVLIKAAKTLQQGGLVAFPTETVYGIGANALDEAAVQAIFEAKGRPQDNPLIIHIHSTAQLETLTQSISPAAQRLMDAFWPGPLTLIFPKHPDIPHFVTSGLDTIGIRMPSHPIAAKLLAAANIPVAAPSANRSGSPSPTQAAHVISDLSGHVHMILDGGNTNIGVESTVVDTTCNPVAVLRPGGITKEALESVLGEGQVRLHYHAQQQLPRGGETAAADEPPKSPGVKYRHYAPKAKVILFQGSQPHVAHRIKNALKNQAWLCASGISSGMVGLIASDELLAMLPPIQDISGGSIDSGNIDGSNGCSSSEANAEPGSGGNDGGSDKPCPPCSLAYPLGSIMEPQAAAEKLFRAFRDLDAQSVQTIFTEHYPEAGIGLALDDRMLKAASGDLIRVDEVTSVLFVCTGNTCRSCMAEALFNAAAPAGIKASSAGISAFTGDIASENAISTLKKQYRIDLSGHRSRVLTPYALESSDLILTMTENHRDSILFHYPEYFHKTFSLQSFAEPENTDSPDISDPYGCSEEVYKHCAAQINKAVKRLIHLLAADRIE